MNEKIFRAYDIRGTYPEEINEEAVKRIAGAYASYIKPQVVAVGSDVRTSSPALHRAVIEGLTGAGVNVVDIGQVPTEVLYFAVGHWQFDGGIQVSASHNPAEFNGLKMVKKGVEALSGEGGLAEIKSLALSTQSFSVPEVGTVEKRDAKKEYLDFVASKVNLHGLAEKLIIFNNNFGLSGPLAKELLEKLQAPAKVSELNFEANGTFPKGAPDPLLAANRAELADVIKEQGAYCGVAWDSDGDRFFVSDEHGEFVHPAYLVSLIATHLLKKYPGEKVIHDARVVWPIVESVSAAGGIPVIGPIGHALMKNRMRQEQALLAGESSGHFYFREFFNADSGILPLLYLLEILSGHTGSLSELVEPLRQKYPTSGEANFAVTDIEATLKDIQARFPGKVEEIDGLVISTDQWRLHLHPSNTESLLRLNVEARDEATCMRQTNAVVKALHYHTGKPQNVI